LIRKRPLAGYTVSPLLTRREFTDMFDMRLVLEPTAARWAAIRADVPRRAALTAEAQIPYAAPEPDADGHRSYATVTAQDARFHALTATAAGSPLLSEAIVRLHAHLHLHRLYFPHTEADTTAREHQRIAAAVQAADPDAAERAMTLHLSEARRRHLAAFD
jgi:DNA-binding GntR family transcriptional regulator